jgi:hypothetical protein
MEYSFIAAIAFLCVLEGLLPFIAPALWRRLVLQIMKQPDRSLRLSGLSLMLLGVVILVIAHRFF